jgi:hypothetical protein
VAAVDLGASSGRVAVVEVGPDRPALTELARFPIGPVRLGGTLHWDVLALYRGVLEGLRAAGPRLGSRVAVTPTRCPRGLVAAWLRALSAVGMPLAGRPRSGGGACSEQCGYD